MTTPSQDVPATGGPPPSGAPPVAPPSAWERIDRQIYNAEQAIVIGGLLVMTLTYALSVIGSNMRRSVNAFDELLLKFAGYSQVASAPESVVHDITTIWTRVVLATLTFGLVLLAIRTRATIGLEPGQAPAKANWAKRVAFALASTAALYGFVKLIQVVPPSLMSLAGLLGLIGIVVYYAAPRKLWTAIGASAIGGAIVAVYFIAADGGSSERTAGFGAVVLMYVGFLGASMAARDERHIKVDAIRKSLKGPGHHLYNGISGIFTIVFTSFLAVMAFLYLTGRATSVNHQASDLPQYIVVLPVCFGFVMMILRFAVRVVRSFRAYKRGEVPEMTLELH